jgi:HlyD family secretion protein
VSGRQEESPQFFRQRALERLSSPEKLNLLMRVVSPLDWLAILAAALLCGGVIAWSFFGTVPTTVTARGVFLRPRRVVSLQTQSAGLIRAMDLRPGQEIRKGDLLAVIDQAEISKRVAEKRRLVGELRRQQNETVDLDRREIELQIRQNQSEQASIEANSQSLKRSIQHSREMVPLLEQRRVNFTRLLAEGLTAQSSADVVESQRAVLDNSQKIADATAKLADLAINQTDLDRKLQTLRKTQLESEMAHRNEIDNLSAQIAGDDVQLSRSGLVLSEYDGRVLEVMSRLGQVLGTGDRLATLELASPETAKLQVVAYFPIKDGKRVQPGMRVQVTPDTVERQRYGGIVGHVVSVSGYPASREGAVAFTGNADLADAIMSKGDSYLEVLVDLDPDNRSYSGFRWTGSTGPHLKVSTGTTSSSRVTVESRSPISYLVPFLRNTSGID